MKLMSRFIFGPFIRKSCSVAPYEALTFEESMKICRNKMKKALSFTIHWISKQFATHRILTLPHTDNFSLILDRKLLHPIAIRTSWKMKS
jgi:hypothetical protein